MPRTSPDFRWKLTPRERIDVAFWEKTLNLSPGVLRNTASGRCQPTGYLLAQVMSLAPDLVLAFIQQWEPVLRDDLTPVKTEPKAAKEPKPKKEKPTPVVEPTPEKESAPELNAAYLAELFRPRKKKEADPEPHGAELDLFEWEGWEYRRLVKAGKLKKAGKLRAQLEELLNDA
jgi:hypothetical protein